jgi:hypothetical protein
MPLMRYRIDPRMFVAELYQNRPASMQLRRGTRGMLTS